MYSALSISLIFPSDKDKDICFCVGNMHHIQFCYLNGDQHRRCCLTAAWVFLLKHHLLVLYTVMMIRKSTYLAESLCKSTLGSMNTVAQEMCYSGTAQIFHKAIIISKKLT